MTTTDRHGKEVLAKRTGEAPLRFFGNVIAESVGAEHRGHEAENWHNIRIYGVAGRNARCGPYVVQIEYRALVRLRRETELDSVTFCDSPAGVIAALREFDPAASVNGYPPGKRFEPQQQNLLDSVSNRYDGQVADVLSTTDEFAEGIPEDGKRD